jgi:hypothetical protein
MDVARSINLSIYDITIQVGAGTFSENIELGVYVTGGGGITVVGTAGSTTISPTSGACINGWGVAKYGFYNFTLTCADDNAVGSHDGMLIYLGGITFSTISAAAIRADVQGAVFIEGSNTITGNCDVFMHADDNGAIYNSSDITLSGTRAFTTFAVAGARSYISSTGSYTGSATGKRYDVTANSVINTEGAGATYFPGDAAGTTATGGQYL